MSEKSLKLIPYGISDYTVVRSGNYIYIDKTKYIEFLESKFLYTFIVRPRRFGKTLFTGMLKKYYDIAACNEFEKNFSGTYIGANKTPLANSFRVLHLNFSGLASDNIADSI
ncbi:MAG: AAA family ATPase, partial [Desulfovibrionaceae bacterium]|nr:AAA family ATPase [Desulfovibrionaceae bacterium]